MNFCLRCGAETKNASYCSRSCASTGRIKSQVTKDKIRASAKANPVGWAKDPGSFAKFRFGEGHEKIERKCQTCDTVFSVFPSSRKRFCSKSCIRYPENHKAGGYREGSGYGKTGWFKGTYCASTWELAYLIFCLDHNKSIKRFDGWFSYIDPKDGNEHRYYPDFIVDGIIIEIKGAPSYRDAIKMKSITGYESKILYKSDLSEVFEYVKSVYQEVELQKLYDDHKPKYTHVCSYCGKEFATDLKKKSKLIFCSRRCSGHGRVAAHHGNDPCSLG